MSERIYMVLKHHSEEMAISIYAMDMTTDAEQDAILEPIYEFPCAKHPRDMASVQLESKIYFLGGRFGYSESIYSEITKSGRSADAVLCPNNVHIFDPVQVCLTSSVPMNTGKAVPVATVVEGKIFVLSSSISIDTATEFNHNSIALFECFDSKNEKWTILDDPPIRAPMRWVFASVVGRKILFAGLDPDGYYKFYPFNYDTLEWEDPWYMDNFAITATRYLSHGRLLMYGLYNKATVRLGPLSKLDQNSLNISMNQYSVLHISKEDSSVRKWRRSHKICQLGKKRYCYLNTWTPCEYYPVIDSLINPLELCVFNGNDTCCGEYELKAEVVYWTRFQIRNSSPHHNTITACYIIDPVRC